MSYILDALKKSDQERKQGEIPTLQTIQNQGGKSTPRKKLWPYLVAAALLINAAVLAYWLRPSSTEEQSTATRIIAGKPAILETTGPEKSQESGQAEVATAPIKQPTSTEPSAPELDTMAPQPASFPDNDDNPLNTPDEEQDPVVVQFEEDQPAIPENAEDEPLFQETPQADRSMIPAVTFEPEEPKFAAKGKIPELDELPPAIRRQLSDMNISAHFYANNPASRMVSINGRILRQGQLVEEGLLVEEITTSGILFNFRDTRFILKVF
ncbi:MAG: general secretion pathway protein GspB [Proteobacteria bacterium]|nr:general secretion pathway protein GspB [Pseudomonadota bacterium]MBU1714446.1 general secretion pathway protein GspB [Pseudomonadota bacterium]